MSTIKSLPSTIRALLQADPTSTEITLVERPLPTPNLEKGEHLIRVYAASPCAGELRWPSMVDIPGKEIITCDDVAGVVVTAPTDSPFQGGEEVYARTSYWRPGCARDYAIATTNELARRPQNLSWAETAAVALSAETAWQALFKHAGVGNFGSLNWKGKRILVTGASGCAGMWVVQIAALTGAEVVGTCGPNNIEFVRSLGAKEALNYRTCNFQEWAEEKAERKVDVVIDCVGGKSLEGAWWCIRDNGIIMSISEPPETKRPASLAASGVKDLFFIMEPSGADLAEVTKLIEEGKCRPIVDSVWPLEHFQQGYQRMENGQTRGKVIFDLMMNTPKPNGTKFSPTQEISHPSSFALIGTL
ncbi:zinc-binding oxidoreductase, putative [Talaromyces stipitatus ATCC 10500]|uniref:Zinc-binding oxidoreductase, putative n=1 Tax=Talaromyces stipitatus (strain ATCC 10500 / CBS 375.48 / QM 6759 / NRRL 1006) TaxID=441959 RepID=B8M565_TALSN|nr:zinc-binding oxidoreductase, putative [Talaromyces stipitatus ATCC 10500]EED19671.1 zinc-binding oxidoreductase, putative [Talaromyces stipitatus ATCC 10500]